MTPRRMWALLVNDARLRNVSFGAFSRIFALGSQFIVLILLGKVLVKSDFGDFMIVFALSRVLSLGMGTGLATLLVYHVSRNASIAREYSLHRSVALVGLLGNSVVAALLMMFAGEIAALFGKPSLLFWIDWLAPFTLMSTSLVISSGVLDGRGRITRSILLTEFVPNLIRLIALPTLLFMHFGNAAVGMVMNASVALPCLAIIAMLFRHLDAGFSRLTSWDFHYSWKLTVHSFAAMQSQGIDMLVVGWLFTSDIAADYAVASRVATLIPFFQQIIVKTFMARVGKAIHEGDRAGLQTEIDRSRNLSVILVTLTAAASLLGYPLLMLWVKNFNGSSGVLAALAVSSVVRSYYPGADALLRIAGLADASLAIMLTSGAFVVLTPIALHGWLGIYAVPLGMFASAALLNPVSSAYIRRRLGVCLAAPSIWLPMALAVAGCAICLPGAVHLTRWVAGVAVLMISLLPTVAQRRQRIGDAHAQ